MAKKIKSENLEISEVSEIPKIKETKAEMFIRLANIRTRKVLKALRILSNCSSSNYEYTQEQVDKIFDAIDTALNLTQNKFTKTTEVKQDTFVL